MVEKTNPILKGLSKEVAKKRAKLLSKKTIKRLQSFNSFERRMALQNIKAGYNIVHNVAGGAITSDKQLDLNKLYNNWKKDKSILSLDYNPEIFPGVVIRYKSGVALLFRSGSVISHGATQVRALEEVPKQVIATLKKIYNLRTRILSKIINIVGVVHFNPNTKLGRFNMERAYIKLTANRDIISSTFEPEQFPGMVLKVKAGEKIVSVLLFATGAAVISGGKVKADIAAAYRKMEKILSSLKLIKEVE